MSKKKVSITITQFIEFLVDAIWDTEELETYLDEEGYDASVGLSMEGTIIYVEFEDPDEIPLLKQEISKALRNYRKR